MAMDLLRDVLRHVLTATPAAEAMILAAWSGSLRDLNDRWSDPAARALVGGFEAPCIAFAFAAGYQAALSRLFGGHGAFRALCVTEHGGNRPRDMHTRLRPVNGKWRLDGEKTYVTGGTVASRLYIAARTDAPASERPALRMLAIPTGRAGVRIEELPPAPFVPELPHARLHLDDVAVAESELLPGDGYARYVKPFRTVEDAHVELALIGQMIRHTRPIDGSAPLLEQLLAAAATLFAVCALPPEDPVAHLLLAGNRHGLSPLLVQLEVAWQRETPAFHAAWLRDRRLLGVAASAREARTARAWEAIRS
jgi:hypothetical protein